MAPFDGKESEYVVASPQVTRSMPLGHQRLLVLAEFLETKVPPKQFTIVAFRHGTVAPSLDECGSAGCALGWCPSIPAFKARGWRWDGTMPVWNRRDSSFGSACAFFKIDHEDAKNFFAAETYEIAPSPHDVAARIRSFVAEQAQTS